jgi:hypothetical protein
MDGNNFDLRLAVQQVACEHTFMTEMFREVSPANVKHYFRLKCIKCDKTLLKEVPESLFHRTLAAPTIDSPIFSWTKAHEMARQMIQDQKDVLASGASLNQQIEKGF